MYSAAAAGERAERSALELQELVHRRRKFAGITAESLGPGWALTAIQSCSDLLHANGNNDSTPSPTAQSSFGGSHSTITAVSPLTDALSDTDRPLRAVLSSPQRPSDAAAAPAAAAAAADSPTGRKLNGRPKNRRAAFRKKSHSLPSFELQAILAARRAKAALEQCAKPTSCAQPPQPAIVSASCAPQNTTPSDQSETPSGQPEFTLSAPPLSNHLASRPPRADGNSLETRALTDADSPSPFTPVTPLSPFTPESQSPSLSSDATIFQQWPAHSHSQHTDRSQCSQLPHGPVDTPSSEHETQLYKYFLSKLSAEHSGRSLNTELENATAAAAAQCSNGGYGETLVAVADPRADNVNGSPSKRAPDAQFADSGHNNVDSSRKAPALVSIEDSSFEAELTEEERQIFFV